MRHRSQFFISVIFCLAMYYPVAAQFTTAAIEGVVTAGEYGDHSSGQNSGSSGAQSWYMTWDNTNLYVAIASANTAEGGVIYLDKNPLVPINGGTNGDGTLVGQNYDGTSFGALQFRADLVLYFKDGYREYRTADGSGGWSAQTAGFGSYASSGGTRELAIPWSAIGGRPSSFAWFGYVTSGGGFVYGQIPSENGSGIIGTSALYERYYDVSSTGDGTSDKPFAGNSYVFNSPVDATNFGAISVRNFTMNSLGQQITRASGGGGDWTISRRLVLVSGTVGSGSSITSITVGGDVTIGVDGDLVMSNAVGGNLSVGGSCVCEGGYTSNGRVMTFTGTGSLSGSVGTDFGDVVVSSTSSVSLATDVQVATLSIAGSGGGGGGGAISLVGHTLTVVGSGITLDASGSFDPNGGAVRYAPPVGPVVVSSLPYHHLEIDAPGVTLSTGGALTIAGSLTVTSGTLELDDDCDVTGATTVAGTLDLQRLGGDLTFHGSATITVSGTIMCRSAGLSDLDRTRFVFGDDPSDQLTIDGTLELGNPLGGTAFLEAQFHQGSAVACGPVSRLRLHGTSVAGEELKLHSSSDGQKWNINLNPTASVSIDRVSVKDSDASSGNLVTATNSIDSGNNLNWNFGGAIAPSITSLDPPMGPVTTIVTITGQNFDPIPTNNTVRFGTSLSAIRAATSVGLEVVVPQGTTTGDVTVEVGGQVSNGVPFSFLDAKVRKMIPITIPDVTGRIADVTGDSHNDFVVLGRATVDNRAHITLYEGMGDGSFHVPVVYTLSDPTSDPVDIDVAFFSSDGREDIVVACKTSTDSGNVEILTVDDSPTGSFRHFAWVQVSGPLALGVRTATSPGGSVYVLAWNYQNDLGVYRQTVTGDPDFDLLTTIPLPPGVTDVAARHVIGDPDFDLLCVSPSGVQLYQNLGSGNFSIALSLSTGDLVRRVAVGDVNGDGIRDVVTLSAGGSVRVFLQRSIAPGTFHQPSLFSAGGSPVRIAVGDVDGDGRDDIAINEEGMEFAATLLKTSVAPGDSVVTFTRMNLNDCDDTDSGVFALGRLDADVVDDIVFVGCSSSSIAPPVVTSVSPISAFPDGGFVVTGRNFGGVTEVTIGGIVCPVTLLSPTSITCTMPPGASTGRLVVTNGDGKGISPVDFVVKSPSARTFVIPHVLETSGRITNTPFTFDTQMFMTYSGGLLGSPNGGGATVDLYLYDNSGQNMRGVSGDVCKPCTYTLGGATRKLEIVVDDLIVTNGGGFDTPSKEGYAVVVVHGDSANVNVQGFVVNSHTSAMDLGIAGYDPKPLESLGGGGGGGSRTFVIPHVLETSGNIQSTSNTFDTEMYAVYTGAQAGSPGGGGATIDLYLYDESGAPMQGNGATVCNPCTYDLSSSSRKQSIRIDDLIVAAGGYGSSTVRLGYGIIVVGGADPDNVALQGFVVNSHTGPFDLAVFGFDPVPITVAAAGRTSLSPKTFSFPHVLETSGKITNTQNTFDTQFFMTYTPGQAGTPPGGGASVDFYLYDESSGQAMKGSNGNVVCNPCTFSLSSLNRKQTINIDDLITANGGGFDASVKLGFGVIVVSGDEDNVALQGFVVNSHTSAMDLSMWGGPPRLVDEAPPALITRTFVLPHVLEQSGSITNTPFTFDTEMYAMYDGGLGGSVGGGDGATVNLYLYDQATGLPITTALGEVCNPCSFPLSESLRKQSIRIDDLIVAKGGFSSPEQKGFASIVVGGDASKVSLQGFVVNSHTSAFDLSVFGFDPQPIAAASIPIPVITIEPTTLDMDAVVVGNVGQAPVTIRNGGGGVLLLSNPVLAPDSDTSFSISSPPSSLTLNAGESTQLTIRFSCGIPKTDVTGLLVLASNGGTIEVPLLADAVLVDPDLFLSLTPDSIFSADPLNPGKSKKPVKRVKPGKPIVLPNWVNLLDETIAQGGFQPGVSESDEAGGMRVGISFMEEVSPDKWKPDKDSAKVRAWVRLTKWDFKKDMGKGYSALQKTLVNKTFDHYGSDPTSTPRGLDSTGYPGSIKRKLLKKQLTKLDPKKTPNKFFAELVALKFNIAASQMGKTPPGFEDLVFDVDSSEFDEMSIAEISERLDSMMTYWEAYPDSEYASAFSVVSAINRAFVGPLDTASFMSTSTTFSLGKLVLKGQVDIDSVSFLRLPDPFAPRLTPPTTFEVESGDDHDFEDEEEFEGLAVATKLYQNYPNPFNPSTTISFRIREESQVTLRIYNVLGQEVATLLDNEEIEEGLQVLQFNGDVLASGVYFYRILAQGLEEEGLRAIETGKMLLLK